MIQLKDLDSTARYSTHFVNPAPILKPGDALTISIHANTHATPDTKSDKLIGRQIPYGKICFLSRDHELPTVLADGQEWKAVVVSDGRRFTIVIPLEISK